MGYYDLFADALLDSRLALDLTPEQVNLTDMIPYEGRYYFQWGPLPVLFHLAPRALGLRLTDRVVCLLVGWLTALLLLAIAIELRKRFFPHLDKGALLWFLFAFALGTPAALVTMRGVVYNEAIGVGALASLGAFWFYLRYLREETATAASWCGAAVAAAILSRFSLGAYALTFFLCLAAALWLKRGDRPFNVKRAALHLGLFSLPILAAIGLHMANNQARFGSPFEFGFSYKPERAERPDVDAVKLGCVAENVRHYFFALPRLSGDFPYIAHEGWPPLECAVRAEASSSLLLASPFLLLAIAAFPLLKRNEGKPIELRLAALGALFPALFTTLTVMTFAAASRRYAHDFIPLLMVAVLLGLAALQARGLLTWRPWRAAFWTVLAFAALINVHVPFYQSFHTPTPDLNVMRAFVAMAPTIEKFAPGPRLRREAGIAAHDMATVSIQDGDYREAVEALEKAAHWMPDEPRIQRNLELARRLADRR